MYKLTIAIKFSAQKARNDTMVDTFPPILARKRIGIILLCNIISMNKAGRFHAYSLFYMELSQKGAAKEE